MQYHELASLLVIPCYGISFFRFSGITEDDLLPVKTTIRDVQAVILNLFNDQTILIGHSLESDFKALKVGVGWSWLFQVLLDECHYIEVVGCHRCHTSNIVRHANISFVKLINISLSSIFYDLAGSSDCGRHQPGLPSSTGTAL